MARKKAEAAVEEAPAKKGKAKAAPAKKGKAKAEPKRGAHLANVAKGRKKGVRKVVAESDKEILCGKAEHFGATYDAFSDLLEAFVEKGVAANVARARKELQVMIVEAKELRKALQDAKANMVEEKIEK